MTNFIKFFSMSQLLQYSQTQQDLPPEPTFLSTTNYYQPQDKLYWHSFALERFNTLAPQPIMDDYRHSFASNLVYLSLTLLQRIFEHHLLTMLACNISLQHTSIIKSLSSKWLHNPHNFNLMINYKCNNNNHPNTIHHVTNIIITITKINIFSYH